MDPKLLNLYIGIFEQEKVCSIGQLPMFFIQPNFVFELKYLFDLFYFFLLFFSAEVPFYQFNKRTTLFLRLDLNFILK